MPDYSPFYRIIRQAFTQNSVNGNLGYGFIGTSLTGTWDFRIGFMYEAHHMMISYRPERSEIWHCYGISRGP
jgi:hypothetical protein